MTPTDTPRGITLIPPGSPEFLGLAAVMGDPGAAGGRVALLRYDLRHRVIRWFLLLPAAIMVIGAIILVRGMRLEPWAMLVTVVTC